MGANHFKTIEGLALDGPLIHDPTSMNDYVEK